MPIGGIDVKSMDGDFCERIGGKSIGEMAANFARARAADAQDDSLLR